MNAKQIWQTTMQRLQAQVPAAVFTTWFQGTSATSFQDGIFVVSVSTTFAKAHLEGRFKDQICSTLLDITGNAVEVQFTVARDTTEHESEFPAEHTLPISKRPYRLPKNRPAPALREQCHPLLIDQETPGATSASTVLVMNSLSPVIAHPTAHLGPDTTESERLTSDAQQQDMNHRAAQTPLEQELSTGEYEEDRPLLTQNGTRAPVLPAYSSERMLNTRYTFNTFIVGKSNQLAHAASLAVSENPGHIYNPLFFYGGVGLGKTHLLHAIGHIGESNGLHVIYVSSEKFTNEIINAIRYQKTEEFRMRYRQIDILLVDDIQFIAGKESTEEEFFHTFNSLHSANKQIVVTSDRPPKAIHSLQDRLRSRFEWGLLADISAPEYEHRLAILRSKAESLRFTIPASVIEYIARPECKSVRELEGALNRVIAFATLHGAPMTLSLAMQALEHIYNAGKAISNLTVADILEGVCRYYNIDNARMCGKLRERDVAWPRQIAMYLMREETDASLQQIGAALGGRDHTTILHGCEKVQSEMESNDRARHEIAAILESLQHKPQARRG